MELRLQPKPEVDYLPADRGIVSRKQFFLKKTFEEINQYFFPALFIRQWKPKAELLYPTVSDATAIQYECDFNRNIQNSFVEDVAEDIFLRTPPPCFVVFGKSGNSATELSKQIAMEYGSVLLNVDEIVNRVMQTGTETAKLLDRILRLGVSLTLNFILALLSYMAHTPEVRHRGYVLCGFPSLAFLQDMPVDQQFNYLFTWDNKPTVFVNVLFEDEDLIKERTSLRYEIRHLGREKSILPHYLQEEESDDKDKTDEKYIDLVPIKEDTAYEPDINISPSRPWVQLPRDEESRVWTELELFNTVIKPAIQIIHSRVDPQCFITVDSRVSNEYEIVKARLDLLQIWKAPEAKPFISLNQENVEVESEFDEKEIDGDGSERDENWDITRVADEPPEVAFLTLFTKKTISPKFRWELSHYNYICPVSLRAGEVVKGKSRFAVFFMKYIYFLHDQECVIKFMKNPRAYVLPVRPRPLCRFFILGYPQSGKTTLARTMSKKFSIPLINFDHILKEDAERKKQSYQEFCRQKAECRTLTRLTALAWQDWRLEEEKRTNLIENWILYIQSLLRKRIEQFYSSTTVTNEVFSDKPEKQTESLEKSETVSGSAAMSEVTLEEKKSKTAKKKNLELLEGLKGLADLDKDAVNAYFSSMWKSFSHKPEGQNKSQTSTEICGEDPFQEKAFCEDEGECEKGEDDGSDDKDSVNWCDLLPPQSLSSILINNLPPTPKIKRQSFKMFLEAAAKAYREPSKLKVEFAKWHLPCFMDIPLCEKFLENPMILLKYLPLWLKERPLIPDPIDPTHPAVVEAGNQAFRRANVVVVKQSAEEQGILLRNAIEKAEREGMRVTGEVITPGGWVVDNMTLDLGVWRKLICENVFADHIYILTDSEPDHRRIINTWWDVYGKMACSRSSLKESEIGEESITQRDTESYSVTSTELNEDRQKTSVASVLEEWTAACTEGDKELDVIYEKLKPGIGHIDYYIPPFSVDTFCHHLLQNTAENWMELNDLYTHEENSDFIQMIVGVVSRMLLWNREVTASVTKMPLGIELLTCTKVVEDYFRRQTLVLVKESTTPPTLTGCLEFFKYIVTLPGKLSQLREMFHQAGRGETIEHIEIAGRTPEAVFAEIQRKLMTPFIKKPRELEDFEMEEIIASSKPGDQGGDLSEEEENESEAKPAEDLRIFGESGELCIVCLERNKYLLGKPEFCLRYYGKLYYFCGQAAKDKFLEEPEKYAPYYTAIRCYPPLRIYVLGCSGSGRTTLASALSRQCDLVKVDYPTFVWNKLVPYEQPVSEKFGIINEVKVLLSEDHNEPAKQLKEMFMRVPYGKRQFWLEHSFHTNYEDNKEMYEFLSKISVAPFASESYPELKFHCVETVFDTYGDDYMELPPRNSDLPEAPYISMKEMTELITNYEKNIMDLPEPFKKDIIQTLWEKEPYIWSGFVIEGFPMCTDDMKQIIENAWIPDAVIELTLPEDVFLERNRAVIMATWENKLKKETAEQEALELALTTIQSNCRGIKQNEMYVEKQKQLSVQVKSEEKTEKKTGTSFAGDSLPGATKDSQRSKIKARKRRLTHDVSLSFEEEYPSLKLPEEVKAEIEATLDEEFPPLIFNPVFETQANAKERVTDYLVKHYKRNLDEVEKLKSELLELDTRWFEIDGSKEVKNVQREVFIKLDKLRRPFRKGEFAFTMDMETAEKLLEQGYYFVSKFGRRCPVQMYRKKNPIHMFRPFSAKGKVTPIAYRNYIYFVAGEKEKLKFLEEPLRYIFIEPRHSNIPLRLAVIGPPKSGKSTLCKRLGATFDLKVITMGSALRFALEETPQSTLAKSINSYLRRGCFLPLSLKLEALMVSLNDPRCVTQGFVFDGIPFDAALTQSLAERGKLPYVIISLVAESHFGKTNQHSVKLEEYRLPYKNRINLESRYKDWSETYKKFANWNQETYNNLYELNAELNTVEIFYQAYDIIKKSFDDILYYVEHCVSDKPLQLQHLCVGNQEYQSKKCSFGNNCTVCWAVDKSLRKSPHTRPRTGLIQYLNYIYWICPDHVERFLKDPKKYIPPQVPQWPELLPERLEKIVDEEKVTQHFRLHGNGRCPVTRVDFPSSLEWEGSWDFAVSYGGKIFLCKNEQMLQRFLAKPWRYWKADTKFEMYRLQKSTAVINLGPPKITSLPPVGFLEQTVADLLHESLQIVGSLRPVYPNLHPRVTGCIFIALYLKIYNKNKKACYLDHQLFEFFVQNCKAVKYKVSEYSPPNAGLGQGDFEPDLTDESESVSLDEPHKSTDYEHNWMDLEAQASKRMWSAKKLSDKYTEMKLTDRNELIQIPEIPTAVTILTYQVHNTRCSPIPPVDDCLNFIYSIPPRLHIPEKFNYNSLYQSPSSFSSPFTPKILFNPHKQFSQSLFQGTEPGFPSAENLLDDNRPRSDSTLPEIRADAQVEPNAELMMKGFFPRFQLLDKFIPTNIPISPQAMEKEPLVMNPHRDYSYMLLFSEFFHNTHILRSYMFDRNVGHLEYLNRLDNTLELTNTQIEYIFKPRITASMKSRTSVDSYQETFASVTPFFITDTYLKPPELTHRKSHKEITKDDHKEGPNQEGSNEHEFDDYLEVLIKDKIEHFVPRSGSLSYESFEINLVPQNSDISQKAEILIHEILPYPPLTWEITSRPYYAYCALSSIFERPHLQDIVHERHVSLLDGIAELHDDYRFVPYPTVVQMKSDNNRSTRSRRRRQHSGTPCYFYFDFFNLPWSAFLAYPYKWDVGDEANDKEHTFEGSRQGQP